jgi:pimeloyl-ACP methyl ester carboxylesterase
MTKHGLAALFILLPFALKGQVENISAEPREGYWMGVMKVSEQMSLQMAYELRKDEEGTWSAKMNVIEQKAFDIPMDACVMEDDSIHIMLAAAGITYDGYCLKDEQLISGSYGQGGGHFTLDLTWVEALPTEVERPQTPVRPFPYDEEEVKFENTREGILLAGTLTKPSNQKNLPAVVLIAGSGRNDRDETPMGHFLLLSDFLTRNGYAVLRYDKRGVGDSEGDYAQATTFDFADDSKAAMEYLKGHPDINPATIGLIGHSEGAMIAPILASEYPEDLSFIVLLGGVGIPGSDLLLIQAEKMSRIAGAPEEEIKQTLESNRKLYEIAKSDEPDSIIAVKMKEAVPELENNMLNMLQWSWFRTFISLDMDTYISKVKCPVLAITGENDVQCPPAENLASIAASLQKGGNESFEIKEMPGLNHLFQTSESGSPLEYEKLPEIISPDVLGTILEWMNEAIH